MSNRRFELVVRRWLVGRFCGLMLGTRDCRRGAVDLLVVASNRFLTGAARKENAVAQGSSGRCGIDSWCGAIMRYGNGKSVARTRYFCRVIYDAMDSNLFGAGGWGGVGGFQSWA